MIGHNVGCDVKSGPELHVALAGRGEGKYNSADNVNSFKRNVTTLFPS